MHLAPAQSLNARGRLLDLSQPVLMGILNLTPDSFSDGGQLPTPTHALQRAAQLAEAGARMLDLGGASTRPGALPVNPQEEWERVAESLRLVRREWPGLFLSIDTFHAPVAQRALDEGADVVNDVTGGRFDANMFATVARANAACIVGHMQGTPATMQLNPAYEDVVGEVYAWFVERLKAAREAGLWDLAVDPGIGFGKTPEHNLQLLRHLGAFAALGVPLALGISRKRILAHITQQQHPHHLPAATALHLHALQQGVRILRVHDADAALQALQVWHALQPPNPAAP